MTDTKKLHENFSKFLELKGGNADTEIVGAWKQKLYDWVKQNAKRSDQHALAAALHQVADEVAVMEENKIDFYEE
tara:strand:+ start:464 stop:688 length:225 start_codon:yes stop_codon:yes gene_type:complete